MTARKPTARKPTRSRRSRRSTSIRDRVVGLERVRAGDLIANEKNWRLHPPEQRSALRGVLKEIGFADALLARRDDDGNLVLIDGHLRREESDPDAELPVLVLDVTEAEADKILLTLDPLASMAEPDTEAIAKLLETVTTESSGVKALLASLPKKAASKPKDANPPVWEHRYDVVIACKDEKEQETLYNRLTEEGYAVRVLTL